MNPLKKLLSFSIGAPLAMLALTSQCLAQSDAFFGNTNGGTATAIKAVAQGTLGGNIVTLINYLLGFLGIVAVAFIIYGGVLLVTSAGNEEAVGKAKKIVTYAAIGFVIIALSYTIVTFVTSALG
jgi:Type IV secretion system pilin